MSDFDIIYRIATDLSGLTKGVEDTAKATSAIDAKLTSLQGSVATVGTAIGAAFGTAAVAAVGAFLSRVLDTADALERMHDKTGISVEGLQRLQIAGDDTGNTIEQITGAITQMQRRIAGGDATAVGALRQLGISFQEFRDLDPEHQFIAVSDAIRKVKDPADQVGLAMAILGRSGAEVLPTLKRGFDDIGESSTVMSTRAVDALDTLGDALARAARATKAFLGEITGQVVARAIDDWNSLKILFGAFPDIKVSPPSLPKPAELKSVEMGAAAIQTAYKDLNEELRKHEEATRKARQEAEKIEKANQKFRDSVISLTSAAIGARQGFGAFGFLMADLSDRAKVFRQTLDNLPDSWNEFHDGLTVAGDEIRTVTIPLFTELPHVVAQNTKALEAAKKATFSWADSLKGLVSGDFLGSLKEMGGELKKLLDPSKILNTAIGGALSGGISAAISFGLKGLGALFGKIFSNPEKQINPLRQAFIDAAGGLDLLNMKAQAAGLTLDRILNAKNPKDYEAAIKELNDALKFQDQAMADLDDAVQRYGLSIDQLGPKFRQQKLDEQAGALFKDYQILIAAGADNVAVLEKMAPAMNAYLKTIMTAGGTIPTQLKEPLQKLLDMGLLTDAAGEKMEDLESLTFAETLDAKFKTLIDSIGKLVDAISRNLGNALSNIPQVPAPWAGWGEPPSFDVPGDNFAATGGRVRPWGIERFGVGGMARGTDTVRAMLTPGELILNAGQQRNVAAALSSGASGNVVDMATFRALQAEQAGTRAAVERMERYFSMDFRRDNARAIREAFQDGRRRG